MLSKRPRRQSPFRIPLAPSNSLPSPRQRRSQMQSLGRGQFRPRTGGQFRPRTGRRFRPRIGGPILGTGCRKADSLPAAPCPRRQPPSRIWCLPPLRYRAEIREERKEAFTHNVAPPRLQWCNSGPKQGYNSGELSRRNQSPFPLAFPAGTTYT